MITDKAVLGMLHKEFSDCRKKLSETYTLLSASKDITVEEKLELNRNFQKIIWNLDDLIWTFDPNNPGL